MSSSPDRPVWFLARIVCLLLLSCGFTSLANAESEPGPTEVWLVTYGPGEIYWQRFGHNAIWVRDRQLGLDHAFNFGFFDFNQEDFLLRFLQGRMLYFSAARPASEEFSSYVNEDRSIRAQRLDLSAAQKLKLVEFLVEEIQPENRDYLYDYYENNCSTRVRDAIDLALGGMLKAEFEQLPASQTWKDHTRRLTAPDLWLYLGLEIGLGSPVDRQINRWEEMFIPEVLADSIAAVNFSGNGSSRPLLLEDVILHESSLRAPPAEPASWWPRYLLLSLGVVALAWLADRYVMSGTARVLSRSWLLLSGIAGLALLYLWFGTDHAAAGQNLNLLVLNPLWIAFALWRGNAKWPVLTVGVFSVLACLAAFLPPGQYILDVLAAVVPLNLAAAVGLKPSRTRPAGLPGAPA